MTKAYGPAAVRVDGTVQVKEPVPSVDVEPAFFFHKVSIH